MTIPDSKILDLKEKAEKAYSSAPGPWFVDEVSSTGVDVARREAEGITERIAIIEGYPKFSEPIAEFIATCDPSIISILVDEIAELRREVAYHRDTNKAAVIRAIGNADGLRK